MNVTQVLILVLLFFGGVHEGVGVPYDFGDMESDELRLRLADKVQEMRTTALNWTDLVPTVVPQALVKPETSRPWRILLDAGHGGKDEGAQGLFRISEKILSLRIARLIKERLVRIGHRKNLPLEVRLSREDDEFLSLKDRVRMTNDWGADLFISIHANSSRAVKARGFEVYFLSPEATDAEANSLARFENEGSLQLKPDIASILSDVQTTYHVSESSYFAEKIFQVMSRTFKPNGRGVRQGPFTVLAGTSMPAVLIEVGFVTNPEDARNLDLGFYLKRLAGAISDAIVEYLLLDKKVA